MAKASADPSLEELERLYAQDDRERESPPSSTPPARSASTRSTSTPRRSPSAGPSSKSTSGTGRRRASTAAQLLDNPGALTSGSGSALQITGIGKVALTFIVLVVALDIYARSTGQTFTLDLLRPTQLFKGSDQAAQLPNLTFPGSATSTPPSATSPGDSSTAGGGGHSNQS